MTNNPLAPSSPCVMVEPYEGRMVKTKKKKTKKKLEGKSGVRPTRAAPGKAATKKAATKTTKKKAATKTTKKKAATKTTKKSAAKKKAATKTTKKKAATKKAPSKTAATKAAATKAAATKKAPTKTTKKRAAARKTAPETVASAKAATRRISSGRTTTASTAADMSARAAFEANLAGPPTREEEAAAPALPQQPPDPTIDLAQGVAALALDKKADDVLILKVSELTSYADCFILASAPSERQVQAIARHVDDEMRKAGKAPVGIEGLEQGHWVLVDLGAVVLHVFLSSARQYYDLEGFWADAPRIDVNEARGRDVVAAMAASHAERRAAAAGG